MSIILVAADDRDCQINAWNWGVLHEIVREAGVFPEDFWARYRFNCAGALEADKVRILADFLDSRVLGRLRPGERMLPDGKTTDVPDDGTFYRDPKEMEKNYSLDRDVLIKLIEFLKSANGPIEVC
jgi:hypothetical protein